MAEAEEILPRNYQLELFEECCKSNSIIALNTGAGKTFIAILLIKEFGHQLKGLMSQGAKRTVFLVNTIPLVHQQATYIEQHTYFTVGHFEGAQGVDYWTAEQWQEQLDKYQVLVMISQVFLDALNHSRIKLQNINLIIADECHHATKCHPMREIFRSYCNSLQQGQQDLPKILGLTACILQGSCTEQAVPTHMKTLEEALSAKIITSVYQQEVRTYSTHAKEFIVQYSEAPLSSHCQCLIKAFGILKSNAEELLRVSRLEKDAFGMLKILRNLELVCEELGFYGIQQAFKSELDGLSSSTQNVPKDVIQFLRSNFETIDRAISSIDIPDHQFIAQLPPKVRKVIDILSKLPKDPAVIVFVKKRNTAKVLCKILQKVSVISKDHSDLKVKYVVGGNFNASADVAIKQSEKQQETLKMFHSGDINTIVSTSVLEEGIDVRACNIIIRFDDIINYRSYIQTLGRARSNPSWYIAISSAENGAGTLQKFCEFKRIHQRILDECHDRNLPDPQDVDNHYDDQELEVFCPYGLDGPKITPNSALQVLNKYIGQLPSDKFTSHKLRETRKEVDDFKFVGLTLPPCALTDKTIWSSKRDSWRLAKKDAGLLMVKELFRLGAFTENLLPKKIITTINANEFIEIQEETKIEEKSVNPHVYSRRLCDAFKSRRPYFLNIIHFLSSENSARDHSIFHGLQLGFLTSRKISCPKFSLPNYAWNGLDVAITSNPLGDLDTLTSQKIKVFHLEVYRLVLNLNPEVFEVGTSSEYPMLVPLTESLEIDFHTLDLVYQDSLVRKFDSNADFSTVHKISLLPNHKETSQVHYIAKVCYDISPLSPMDKSGKDSTSFEHFYAKNYNLEIKDLCQPLFECGAYTTKLDFLSSKPSQRKHGKNRIHLIPELCKVVQVSSHLWWKVKCAPSILLRINGLLLEQDILEQLQYDCPSPDQWLDPHWSEKEIQSLLTGKYDNIAIPLATKSDYKIMPGMILQPLTSIHMNDIFNLELLEVLGDAFLKISTSRLLFCARPNEPEGYLTAHRSIMISNNTLRSFAKKKSFQNYCQNMTLTSPVFAMPFGFVVKKDVEDLFLEQRVSPQEWNVNKPVEQLMKMKENTYNPFCDQLVASKRIADVVEAIIGALIICGGEKMAKQFMEWFGFDIINKQLNLPKTALRDHASSLDGDEIYRKNYLNNLETIIGYTFKDKSWLVEACTHPSYQGNQVTNSYQRLEFLGDAVLDYLMTCKIYAMELKTPGEISDLRTHYVNNETLAKISVQHGAYKYILHHSVSLESAIDTLLKENVLSSLESSEDCITEELFQGSVMKVLGDHIEALIGAIYCDCLFNYEPVWNVLKKLFTNVLLDGGETIPINPVRGVNEFYSSVKLDIYTFSEENDKFICSVKGLDTPTFTAKSSTKSRAKYLASRSLWNFILENDLPKPKNQNKAPDKVDSL